MRTRILLIRHAESEKNLMDIHGGKGMPLTENGRRQAYKLAQRLSSYGVDNTNSYIFSPDSVQTQETAEIIQQYLNVQQIHLRGFKTLDMGIVKGLSNLEIRTRFPDVYERLKKWRNKKSDISELCIEQMESPEIFYLRGKKVLEEIQDGKFNIFVLTTSLYILLTHILLGDTVEKGGGYVHINVNNGEQTCFIRDDNGYRVCADETDVEDILEIAQKKELVY